MIEVWKTLVYQGKIYLNFQVSSIGRLKNLKTGTIYKLNICGTGYLGTVVSIANHKKMIKIHRAVAETFIPNPDNKPEVNHIDGNKQNNCVENLEWNTCAENINHAYKNKLIDSRKHTGCNSSQSKLSPDDVKYIRCHYIPKDPENGCRALARKFRVSHTTITNIITNKSYFC